MKNLVRGGLILTLTGLFVVFIYAQTRSESSPAIANDSQIKIENNISDNNLVSGLIDQQNSKEISSTPVAEAQPEPTPVKKQDDEKQKADGDNPLIKKTASVRKAGASRGSFSATAYCFSGRTALGHPVRRGLIAADPRVLKLGSKVVINAGPWSGTYLVSDTGGAIKGKRIDIWVPSCSEARKFGRRSVQIFSVE